MTAQTRDAGIRGARPFANTAKERGTH